MEDQEIEMMIDDDDDINPNSVENDDDKDGNAESMNDANANEDDDDDDVSMDDDNDDDESINEDENDDESNEENDDINDDNDNSNSKSNNQTTKKVQTDEYGRELSAYEIMRLERIRRNQAYLAQLGLEEGKSNVTQSIQREKEEKKKERQKKKEMMEDVVIERRQSRARKSKAKEVDYSGDFLKGIFKQQQPKEKKVKKEGGEVEKTRRKEKKRSEMVPRFIYREFEHIKKCRNKAVANGKRLVKAAELECRIARRKVDKHQQQMKRKMEREERQMTLHTKKLLQPIVEEIDSRRGELLKAKKDFDAWVEMSSKKSNVDHEVMMKQVEDAKIKFPLALQRNEHELGLLLRARLMPQREDNIVDSLSPLKKRKKKKKFGDYDEVEEKKIENSAVENANAATTTATKTSSSCMNNSKIKDSDKKVSSISTDNDETNATMKKSTQVKARNVGGPVTPAFASSVQRKWLERDTPIPADISTSLVPQVGDVVLYYPCAHYAFLKENPDTRCVKQRLKQRRPLWERAQEEKDIMKESKNVDDDDKVSKKAKALLNNTPWWTSEWIKTVDGNAGTYPILCRVEKVICEFPYDAESMTELRRFNYKKKKVQEGKDSDVKEMPTDNSKRRPLNRKKPSLGLNVSLRPLSKTSPPERSKKKNGSLLFDECKLSLPPLFSVLTFPCDEAPFLVPFFLAFRLSLSISAGDQVKLLDNAGSQQSNGLGTVCKSRGQKDDNALLEIFTEILNRDAKADLSTLSRIDTFITKCYEKDSNYGGSSLPEADLRAVIAAALYQCHKQQVPFMQLNSLQNENTSQTDNHITNERCPGLNNLLNWILFSLPRWKGVKIAMNSDNTEAFFSVWDFISVAASDDDSQEGILAAALAPSVLITSTASNYGGFIYTLDERLRLEIEKIINGFIENNNKAAWFVTTITDKTAPEYSRFVPCSMSLRRIIRRLKIYKIKHSKHNNDTEDPTENDDLDDCCYYRSVGAILSDIADIYQNCLIYNK